MTSSKAILIAPASIIDPIIAVTLNMEGALRTDVFFHPFFSPMLIGTEHEMLTTFPKLKPHVFQDLKNENTYKFILDHYELLHKLSIMH